MQTVNNNNILLRPAKHEDKAILQDLYKRTIDHSCTDDYDERQREAWKMGTENEARWDTAIEEQYFIIAEIAGEMAGFGSLKDSSYIDFMYTSANHLRKGVAQTIYDRLEAKAAESGAVALTSDVSKTARPFFENQGFRVVRENQNLIRNVWITNYHMRKELTN